MTHSEASDILELNPGFDREGLKLAYHRLFVSTFRSKSFSQTMDESKELEKKLVQINQAFCLLDKSEILSEYELQLDFRHDDLEKYLDLSQNNESNKELTETLDYITRHEKFGLALSLLEEGITTGMGPEQPETLKSIPDALRLLGKVLISMGLVNQGIKYLNFGLKNYNKALNYKRIGEYRLAAHHFAMELKNKETEVPIDEICQKISICYFLLGDFENAIQIIEEVLPNLLPRKSLFDGSCKAKDFATAIMVSMFRLDEVSGKKLDNIKIRLKYPLCFKYLQNCYGNLDTAFKVIEEFEKNNNSYDEFLRDLKPKTYIRPKIILTYELLELHEYYFQLFRKPLRKSLLYHPK